MRALDALGVKRGAEVGKPGRPRKQAHGKAARDLPVTFAIASIDGRSDTSHPASSLPGIVERAEGVEPSSALAGR